jgi:hypothetical protein
LDVNLTVAPSLRMWADAPAELVIRAAGLLGGAGLAHVDDELDAVSSHWGPHTRTVRRRSTVAEAAEVLASHDLAHIAAHGTFRSDNPYFSSIEFVDGPLTLLDLDALPSVPHVVVIASCDAAATAGGAGTEVVGTTSTMLGLGVSAVIAPTVVVGDLAARGFSADLHRLLVAGESIDAAACEARRLARLRGTPADRSAAQSFQVHGNSAASQALRVARS